MSGFITNLCNLSNKKIILASQSPRRIELLRSVGLQFDIFPAQISEKHPHQVSHPAEVARHLALEKGKWVQARTSADLIIAADTVVVLNNQIFEKPSDQVEAYRMLQQLSGKTHRVITGVALLTDTKEVVFHEETVVRFYPLTDEEIKQYIATGEPLDKAGAYGIQGYSSLFIERIEGCYFNVVGFPLSRFYQELKKIFS